MMVGPRESSVWRVGFAGEILGQQLLKRGTGWRHLRKEREHENSLKSSGYPHDLGRRSASMPSNVSTHQQTCAKYGVLEVGHRFRPDSGSRRPRCTAVPKSGELGEDEPHPMRAFSAAPKLGKHWS